MFGKFSANHYESTYDKVYFSKISCLQHILLKIFRRMRLYCENCSLRRILFYIFKQHSKLEKPHCKNFWTLKMKVVSDKEQKSILLVVSRSVVQLVLRTHFSAYPIGCVSKTVRPKSRALRKILSTPVKISKVMKL